MLGLLEFPKARLPEIVKPTDFVGKLTKAAADETGLVEGTPIVCGTTDTAMEVFAAGAVNKGDMTVKLATAGRICVICDRSYPDPNSSTTRISPMVCGIPYGDQILRVVAALYRDTFGGNYREIDEAAARIPIVRRD